MSFVLESVYQTPSSGDKRSGPSDEDNAQHQAVGAWFLGPQAENFEWFKSCINSVIDQQRRARTSYYPTDGKFITAAMKDSPTFLGQVAKLENYADRLSDLLNKHSIPFWSARYSAHMTCDTSMPAILGYLMTMLFNPNNVALEASPITTLLEMMVGEQLCSMLRYNLSPQGPENPNDLPISWGHITCDGTVANLESIWAARNLKFYPLSLKKAMRAELSFISDSFKVEVCKGGEPTLFDKLCTWDLLNLKARTILDIPDRLRKEYGISSKFLQDVMGKYSIQSVGKDVLEKEFEITQPIQYMVSATKHYSWPKGAAITGIGSENVINVRVDNGARLDPVQLEEFLNERLERKQAVYAVVAIIGTTEEGAVDPIAKVLELRENFQAQGMSFVVHADAAWGGYFASTLPPKHKDMFRDIPEDYVGMVPLRKNTTNQLLHLHLADSITIDPHKTGYIPYPAGALCYRDNRMKYLVTWTTPYISRDPTAESIGVYGVEGSKPGAAAGATFLSHKVIGLNERGYGGLLSETVFTCSRLSAHWATMDNKNFVVVPFNMLPSEEAEGSTPEMVEKEKQDIRDLILNKNNWEVSQSEDAMKLLGGLGSDLIVNAFACNFRLADGTLNDDVEEANNLNRRIVNRLSVTSPNKLPAEVPFFLTSTEFLQHDYGDCATNFKKRLGLKGDTDLFVLRNVTMSPFPTERNFIAKLARIFENVAKEEVEYCRKRVSVDPTDHSFIMQGTKTLYLAYKPLFYEADNRQQLIITAKIPDEAMGKYVEARKLLPETPFVLKAKHVKLPDILESGNFTAEINFGDGANLIKDVEVTEVSILKQRDLRAKYRDPGYPIGYMPFYLYGTPEESHIDHMLLHAPSIQLAADNVTFEPPLTDLGDDLKKGAILYINSVSEISMQPFDSVPSAAEIKESNFFFRQGKTFNVSIYKDPNAATAVGPGLSKVDTEQIATGEMTLTENVYADKDWVNSDPFAIKEVTEGLHSWKAKIDKEFP